MRVEGSIYNDIKIILLTFVIFTIPFGIHLNSLLIICFAFSWVLEGKFKNKFRIIIRKKYLLTFISLYFLHILALLYSENLDVAFSQLEKKASLLILPLLIATMKISRKNVNLLVHSQIFSVTLACIICFVSSLNEIFNFQNDVNNAHFRGVFTQAMGIHHVYLSIYICLAILFLCFLISKAIIRDKKTSYLLVLYFLNVGFLFYMISILVARSVIIGFFIALVVSLSLYIIKSKSFKTGLAGILMTGIIFFLVGKSEKVQYMYNLSMKEDLTLRENLIFDYTDKYWYDWNSGTKLRLAIWSCVLEVYKNNNPLIGVGTGDVQHELMRQYTKVGFQYAHERNYTVHNQYLDFLLRLGIIGTILFLFIIIYSAIICIKKNNYLYLSFLILFCVCCITESTLEVQKGIVFFGLFNSLFAFNISKFNV